MLNQHFWEIKVSYVGSWLKGLFIRFRRLIKSIINLPYFAFLIRFQIADLLIFSFFYPLNRILLGREKSGKICQYLFDNYVKKIILPRVAVIPFSPKTRIALENRADWSAFAELYEDDIYQIKTLKEGMAVVDVGAHIGLYTIPVAGKVGNRGMVIAIEPEKRNYSRLLENIKLNNLQNVIPVNLALTDHEGFEKLYLDSSPESHSLISKENKISSIEVPVKTLDNLLEKLNLKKVDIIKIDAEGAEAPILKGAEKTLKINPNLKIIVASYHYPSEIKEVQNFLENKGYKTKVFSPGIVITS